MSHRAGTGDMPIPGQVLRRNPAYKLRAQAKAAAEAKAVEEARSQRASQQVALDYAAASAGARGRRRSPSYHRSPSRESIEEEARRSAEAAQARRALAESREREDREKRGKEDEQRRRLEEMEDAKRRAYEAQEKRWQEERNQRLEAQRRDEQRMAMRKHNLKGAFASVDELDEEPDDKRSRPLIAASSSAALPLPSPVAEVAKTQVPSGLPLAKDPLALRAALADPSANRNFTQGEVAEQLRLLAEMKRKFRRKEFGSPPRRARSHSRGRRQRSRSRSRSPAGSRDPYASVWIRPSNR